MTGVPLALSSMWDPHHCKTLHETKIVLVHSMWLLSRNLSFLNSSWVLTMFYKKSWIHPMGANFNTTWIPTASRTLAGCCSRLRMTRSPSPSPQSNQSGWGKQRTFWPFSRQSGLGQITRTDYFTSLQALVSFPKMMRIESWHLKSFQSLETSENRNWCCH